MMAVRYGRKSLQDKGLLHIPQPASALFVRFTEPFPYRLDGVVELGRNSVPSGPNWGSVGLGAAFKLVACRLRHPKPPHVGRDRVALAANIRTSSSVGGEQTRAACVHSAKSIPSLGALRGTCNQLRDCRLRPVRCSL